jgi:orotidine-5'-phosphate decarboxylase
MNGNRFGDRLAASWAASRYVCAGLDPDLPQLRAATGAEVSAGTITRFTRAIVDATCDLVIAYKPNSAFYEQFGPAGMQALQDTIAHIHSAAPHAVVILDAKRGDVEHTNAAYATALFDIYDADAVTVSPYLGAVALAPYLDRLDRGVIVLCRTSNPGGGELQDLPVRGVPLYQHIATLAQASWNHNGNCGLLVGATYPAELREVRARAPGLPLLIAGVGRQQGSLQAAVRAGATADGGILVSASRSVTHISPGADLAGAARSATLRLHESVLACLAGAG